MELGNNDTTRNKKLYLISYNTSEYQQLCLKSSFFGFDQSRFW